MTDAVTVSDEKLAECPFCGGDDSEDNATQSAKVYLDRFRGAHGGMAVRVACRCGATGKAADCANRQPGHAEAEAIAAWNRRAHPSRDAVIDECAKAYERGTDGEREWVVSRYPLEAIRALKSPADQEKSDVT